MGQLNREVFFVVWHVARAARRSEVVRFVEIRNEWGKRRQRNLVFICLCALHVKVKVIHCLIVEK